MAARRDCLGAVVTYAKPEQCDALARALARSFHDDPVTTWVFEDAEARPGYSSAFFGILLRRMARHELTWTTEDEAGAAIWAPPGKWRESPLDLVRMARATMAGLRPGVLTKLSEMGRIERKHPSEPHLYLACLGVDAGRQGEGLGTALLAPGLARCDELGLPAYLESSNPRNVPLYERHGFEVTEETSLRDGPPIWLMWRERR